MSILLDSDATTHPQTHLDELSLRVTVWFLVTAVLTLVWSLYVDSVLEHLLRILTPCNGPCMNVYDPAQWSAVRWSTALLLALFSSLPVMLHQIHQFAKPGLMRSEFLALKRWTRVSSISFLIVAYSLVFHIIPDVFSMGYNQHLSAGLVAQYDAVQILMVTLYLVWVCWLFFATWLLMFLAGTVGLITRATSDWWRLRIYGIGTLLLIVTLPDHARSMMLPLITVYLVCIEVIGTPWFQKSTSVHGEAKQRFDQEGRRRKYGIIDCSCEGANLHQGHAFVEGFSTFMANGVCRSTEEQERIYEHLIRNGLTDAVVTGCDTMNCPIPFKQNLQTLDVHLHGLNLMRLQNHRVLGGDPSLEVELGLYQIVSGSHDINITDELQELVRKHGFVPSQVTSIEADQLAWGPFTAAGPIQLR